MLSTMGSELKFNGEFPVHVTGKKKKINKIQERTRFRLLGMMGTRKKKKKKKTGKLNAFK